MSTNSVFECSASYYNPATKKWETGNFTISKNHIQFICSSRNDELFHLCLPLSTITGLEKRQYHFIYPSLVVCIGSEKHWFGSFASRDAVYNLLELFWRESLVSKPHKKPSPMKAMKSNSALGKELLELLCESKNTLIGTANELSDQSRQLYDAEEAVEDVNNDLTIAEDALKPLPLPLMLTNLVTGNIKENVDYKISQMHRYKVTFSFSNSENKIDWEKGVLAISNDAIFLKVEEHIRMQVTKNELDVLQVLSPWELCIIHTFSGERKSCYFMCPQLSRLLKFVSSIPHYQEKIIYIDDDSSVYDTASCYSSSSLGSAANTPSSSSAHSNSPKKLDSNSNSTQTQVNTSTLSEEEIQEINSILQDLQTLAAEVGREQENQIERINVLIGSTEKAEIRLKKCNKSMEEKY